MKKFLPVLLIAILLTACAPQAVVTLPDELSAGIVTLSVLIVGWVFAQIGAAWPWFVRVFGHYQDEFAFIIAGAVIGTLQTWLGAIPLQWEPVANILLMLVVAVLAALQVFRLIGKAGVKTFRA